jgi:hypothetical protein
MQPLLSWIQNKEEHENTKKVVEAFLKVSRKYQGHFSPFIGHSHIY